MRISANQITLSRIVLLPFPLFLLYGDTEARVASLLLLAALGLTDYLDGLIARREGSTPLGRLLDPIADKIFIAVTFIPLVDLNILPLWIIWPIFLREFLVTEMRRFARPDSKGLKVTELAKLKTTLQMVGVGLIILTDTFPDRVVTISFLAGLLLSTMFLAVTLYCLNGRITPRVRTALLFEVVGLSLALILSSQTLILVYGLIILGITLLSGYQYAAAALPGLLQAGLKAVGSLTLSVAPPLMALVLLPTAGTGEKLWVALILAVEFAVQGLDMWAGSQGRMDISMLKRMVLAPIVLLFMSGGLLGFLDVSMVLRGYAALMSLYLFLDIYLHRALFLGREGGK